MNQALTKTASSTLTGHFDGVENSLAVGWAFDSTRPGQRLQVEVLCDDEVVAFGIADHFREDLVPAGIGDGKHLFRLPISYELMDGRVHSLTAREANTGLPLHGDAVSFGPEAHNSDIDLVSRKQGLALLEQMLQQPEFSVHAGKATAFAKLYRIGALAQETSRLEDARYVWDALQKALGDNALCHCKLGETYLIENRPQAALDAYRAAVTANFSMHYAHVGMAQARHKLGQYVEAEEALEMAAALQPSDFSVQARLEKIRMWALPQRVDALLTNGQHEQAMHLLKHVLLTNPDHHTAKNKLGDILTIDTHYDFTLPGITQLKRLQTAQRLLDFFLKDDQSGSNES